MTHLKEEPRMLIERAEEFGYAAFGPLILRFCTWLAKEARRQEIRRLYFLSREGYFLLELYKKCMALGLCSASDIEARYLLISRRAAFGAASKTRETLRAMVQGGPFEGPLYDLLEARMGLSRRFCEEKGMQNLRVDVQNDTESILNQLEPLLPALNELADQERKPLLQYLRQEAFFEDGAVALVDVGYSASIQRWIGSIAERPLAGFYFATTKVVNEWQEESNRVFSCFATDCGPTKMPPVYRYALASESWLTAPSGQVLRFSMKDGLAIPEFAVQGQTQKDFHVAEAVSKGVARYMEDLAFLAPFDPNWELNTGAMAQDILAAAMESGAFGTVLEALSVEDAFCGNGEISLSQRVADLTSSVRLSEVHGYGDDPK